MAKRRPDQPATQLELAATVSRGGSLASAEPATGDPPARAARLLGPCVRPRRGWEPVYRVVKPKIKAASTAGVLARKLQEGKR